MSFDYGRFVEEYFKDKSLTENNAWQHIYRLVWSKNSNVDELPEIKESNKLENTDIWETRARRAERYLSDNLGVNYQDPNFDLIFKAYVEENDLELDSRKASNIRGNIRGEGFEHVVQYVIKEVCGVEPLMKKSVSELQGYETAESSSVTQPDLILFSEQDYSLLMSTKWTLRKDRLKQFLHEAEFYRKRRPDLNITMVTNDIDTNYLTDLIENEFTDRIYHIHKPLLFELYQPLNDESLDFDGLLEESDIHKYIQLNEQLYDLQDLFDDVNRMRQSRSL